MKISNYKLKIRAAERGFLKLTKRTLALLLIISILLPTIILYSLFMIPKKASAAWYDDSWAYRQAITITVTSSASDVTNSQTIISVNTSTLGSKLQSACQDLRFTNTNGKLLPYYIASSCNNSSTTGVTIWVLADLVPKNTTTYTMYMYYGNPQAAAGSDSSKFSLYTGLVGYWPMDEASANSCAGGVNDNCDSSGNGNNGAWNGNATSAAGKYGNGVTFDGNGDYVDTGSTFSSLTSAFTVSAWVKPGATQVQYADIFGNHGGSLPTPDEKVGMVFQQDDNNTNLYYFSYGNGTDWITTTDVTLTANTWQHIVALKNSSGTKVYVNGVESASATSATNVSASDTNFMIGKGYHTAREFNGQIDEARIYNRALSATDVSQLYNTSQPTTSFASEEKAPSPVAYWKFDDGQGTTAQDSTTNNNDGTISGATWQTEGMCVSGKCLYFDGTTSYVQSAANASINGTAFTAAAWIKPNTTDATYREIFAKRYSNSVDWEFEMNGGNLVFNIRTAGPTDNIYTTTGTPITANQWNYVVATYNSNSLTMYVNGRQVFQNNSTATLPTPASNPLTIGALLHSGSYIQLFKGFIDEPKIYNYARTASQIQADYNARGTSKGLSLSTQGETLKNLSNGLVGYWKMDESSTPSVDSSGNGNSGTWNGNTAATTGKFGNGTTFDGTGDYTQIADASVLKGMSNLTVSAWIKASNNCAATECVFLNKDQQYTLAVKNGTIQYDANGSDWAWKNSSYSVTAGNWYFVTLTYDGAIQRLYINGNQQHTTAETGAIGSGTDALIIGSASGTVSFYNGVVDEVRAYNRALSANEVSQLYNFAPGPRVELKMEEGSGTSTNDSSGNSRTGTINGNPVWSPGKYGKGIKMDGTGDNVSVGDF